MSIMTQLKPCIFSRPSLIKYTVLYTHQMKPPWRSKQAYLRTGSRTWGVWRDYHWRGRPSGEDPWRRFAYRSFSDLRQPGTPAEPDTRVSVCVGWGIMKPKTEYLWFLLQPFVPPTLSFTWLTGSFFCIIFARNSSIHERVCLLCIFDRLCSQSP